MQRYVHNVYRSHAQSGEGFDTPSAPCVPVNKGQDIHLRTIEDIGHARESARPILNRVLRKTEAGSRWSLNFVLLPNRPRTLHNQTVTDRGNVVKNLFVGNLGPEVTHEELRGCSKPTDRWCRFISSWIATLGCRAALHS
jgi:hypothetical protein